MIKNKLLKFIIYGAVISTVLGTVTLTKVTGGKNFHEINKIFFSNISSKSNISSSSSSSSSISNNSGTVSSSSSSSSSISSNSGTVNSSSSSSSSINSNSGTISSSSSSSSSASSNSGTANSTPNKNNINKEKFVDYSGLYNINSLRNLNNSKSKKIKSQINNLVSMANKLLKVKNYPTVTDKTILVSKGENKHDFASMTPYLWSDPSSKSGYIVKDGVDNPERLNSKKFDAVRLNKMVSDLNTLSIAYAITGNKAYAKQATNFLKVWFIDNQTKMNPNMKYAEIFVNSKGETYFSGSSMISAIPFISVVNDIYLIENSKYLSSNDNKALKEWFGAFANWLLAQKPGGLDRLRIDNHGTWLQAELATFYEFAGQYDKALNALKAVGPDAIFPQIKKNGKIPSALIRTKSVAYTEFNLEAFITLATMGEKLGVPIWNYVSPNGGSIKGGIDYLDKYLLGEESWPYQNIKGKDVEQPSNKIFMLYLAMAYKQYKKPVYLQTILKYTNNDIGYRYLLTESYLN